MRPSLRNFAAIFLLAIASFMASQSGFFRGIDNTFREWRFANHDVETTGEIVFIDIDARSLQQVGQWPWPRWVHAGVLDKLVEYGADEIAFDVDFSSKSSYENDQILADALEEAGGFTYLAALQQVGFDTNGTPLLITNVPIALFREHSELALVNVEPSEDGLVWEFTKYGMVDERIVASLPTIFSPKDEETSNNFYYIDYAISLDSIDRISLTDLLNGQVDPSRIAGKKAIVGASALELGDLLEVPRYGRIPGPMVQILAAETRLQGRELRDGGPVVAWFIFLLVALVVCRIRKPPIVRLALAFVASAAVLELFALYAQSQLMFYSDTFWFHGALLLVFVLKILEAMDLQRLLVRRVSDENSRMQIILDRVVADNFDGVIVINSDLVVLAASRPAEEMFSPRQELTGSKISMLPDKLYQEISAALERAKHHRERLDETVIYVLETDANGEPELVIEYSITVSTINKVDDDDLRVSRKDHVACLTFRDITHRYIHQKRMDYLANHDPLTGAFTRARLEEELQSFIAETRSGRPTGLTLVLLDLDRFKNINETLGHAAGDGVLKEVARRMNEFGLYSVARLGADRFAGVTPHVLSHDGADDLAERLMASIVEPYALDGHRALLGVSIGMTDTNNSGLSANSLISHADMALSEAKGIPGNSHFLFMPELNDRIQDRQRVEMALLDAVGKDQLYIRYQPQVDMVSGLCLGAEALVRWQHPELGTVRPDRFISVAEDSGMIIEIGRWVLERACCDAMAWPKPGKLAVNVSAVQFEYGDVVSAIKRALEISKLPAERLDIEITESVFVTKQDKFIQTLNEIVEMGVGVALDDFGTGYSSLSYLSRLPVDKVKIDQSFVRNLPHDEQSMAIVQSVLSLSAAMDKRVVAEGIETQEQAWVLRLAGCGIGQGYLFGRPQSNKSFCTFFELDEPQEFLQKAAS